MQVRKLNQSELFEAHRAMAVAFHGGFDPEKEREDLQKPESAEKEAKKETWGAYSDDGKTLYSCFDLSFYEARFDGAVLPMAGVGGVATLPPYRRMGGVRACMEKALKSLYERRFGFAFLYPFSTAFYRQFGFENGGLLQTWTVPISTLDLPDAGGSVEELFPGDDLSPLLEIYNRYSQNLNLSCLRREYNSELKENLLDQKRYIFLWRDETGSPRSFLICHGENDVLNCTLDFPMKNGLLFSDARSLQALLRFVKTAFIANYRALRFTTPFAFNPISFLSDMAQTQCDAFPNGMVRVIHLETVLSHCRCRDSGELILEVTDPILEQNRGVWQLQFAPGKENLVQKAQKAPDVTLDIHDLSALLCGARDAQELSMMPGVIIHRESAPFQKVFYRKPFWCLNLF